jgi:hypothetical protein
MWHVIANGEIRIKGRGDINEQYLLLWQRETFGIMDEATMVK